MVNLTEWIVEKGIKDMQQAMESGELSSEQLVNAYLERIGTYDKKLRSVLEVNPEAVETARELDRERKEKGSRGLLHGIPFC